MSQHVLWPEFLIKITVKKPPLYPAKILNSLISRSKYDKNLHSVIKKKPIRHDHKMP